MPNNNIGRLVVYGDSYSDIHQGTKRTNGELWNQQLAKGWNFELVSYAKPLSTFCPNSSPNGSWLKKQVEKNHTTKDSNGSIHIIFLGVTELIETQGKATKIQEWIHCIKDQIVFLASSNPNSKTIIMGVPALEFSPYAISHPSFTTNLKQNIIDFNVALEDQVLDWNADYPVEFFDTYLVFSNILGSSSTTAHIDNVDDAYWERCQGKCNASINSYLWYDSVHVTESGHTAISNTIATKEFFNMKLAVTEDSGIEGSIIVLPRNYARYAFWLLLAIIAGFFMYAFRHNKIVVSFKKKVQGKVGKAVSRFGRRDNDHEYALV